MTGLQKRGFLLARKLGFLLTPVERRVRLELETDGRQITFLLVSLHALGYAVHVVGSSMVFRELLALRNSAALPFIIGGPVRECGVAIADTKEALARGVEPKKVLLDYDYFNTEPGPPRMPYFMHPAVYAAGLHKLAVPTSEKPRKIRIAFFGSRDTDFYTRDFHFPILNREQILESFLGEFEDRIWKVDRPSDAWIEREIAVAIDTKGGDRGDKSFLPMADYLEALRQCDFFLSPPGKCMPYSHNLIEGLAAGCIPILNYPELLDPALQDGINCLAFRTTEDLRRVIGPALQMTVDNIEEMRGRVLAYYNTKLSPGQWLRNHLEDSAQSLIIRVNAEEISIAIATSNTDHSLPNQ